MIEKGSKNKIQKQLFLNYVIIFVLEAIIIVLILFLGNYFVDQYKNSNLQNPDVILDKIYENRFYSLHNIYLPPNVIVELLDDNFQVLDSINSTHNIGYKYKPIKLLAPKTNTSVVSYTDTDLSGNKINSGYYIITSDWENILLKITKVHNAVILITFLLCLFLTFIVLSKLNARKFIDPINKLLYGLNQFQNHNYGYIIDYKYNNELDDLKDSLNNMSANLHNELLMRKKAENNKKQLILDITHDIKTPLTNITGYCEILKNEELDYVTHKKYLDVIIANSDRINTLIKNLHEVSYSNGDALTMDIIDISEMLRELVIEFIPIIESISMSYDVNIPDNPIYCNVDKQKIYRALSNIINNSIKYSGINTTLFIKMNTNESHVIIVIKDTGKGMSKTLANNAFEPFIRGDKSRNSNIEGSGIGLTISKKLVEMHGGSIALDTNLNNGCKITILLPLHLSK
ncbi:HAMP domain-containing sensor histidine kinase [Clostridiaceae bacterium M8S5]|nr:HAMP domain-containing sensor histidine kinase [Clostridiaceae bacterium M8S5]